MRDGEFFWKSDLVHYIRVHGVRVPDNLIRPVEARDFTYDRPTFDAFMVEWADDSDLLPAFLKQIEFPLFVSS